MNTTMSKQPTRRPTRPLTSALAALAAALGLAAPGAAGAATHDYPTLERVRIVQDCMTDNPGPVYEMTVKCSCMTDGYMQELTLDELTELSTVTKANSIGGERGGYIRDAEPLQKDIRRFRDITNKLKKSCMITR